MAQDGLQWFCIVVSQIVRLRWLVMELYCGITYGRVEMALNASKWFCIGESQIVRFR